MMLDQELVREFLLESFEALDRLDRELLGLEKNREDMSLIGSIFRGVHTIKGTSLFFELTTLEHVAHVGENLLDSLRSTKITCSAEVTSILFRLLDAIRKILSNVERTGKEGDENFSELVEAMKKLNETPQAQATDDAEAELNKLLEQNTKALWEAEAKQNEVVAAPVATASPEPSPIATPLESASPTITQVAVAPKEPPTPTPAAKSTGGEGGDHGHSAVAESSIRVDIGLLDQLMNLVGELVLSRNQILQFSKSHQDAAFLNASQRLNLITSELQENVMKTRMQPVANVWNKFPRIVRDLARQLNKQIKLEMDGKDTELDKTIIEAIKDPLTHIIRNSIDHGIEMPDKREASGKAKEGTVTLRAFHEGGQVIMEISDDGAGLNSERIKQKALEKGLISAEKAKTMSEQDLHRLVFLPGFSTAAAVTNVSGRGVGMDVVRSNIERIGGQVDIVSRTGEGSTIRIKIPLTLAIIPALIVSSHKERFAIPQVVLVELVRVEDEQLKLVEKIGDSYFYRLRGNLLPLVSLSEQLNQCKDGVPGGSGTTGFTFVVVRADETTFGLIVDEVHDTEEIVVKPLGKQLKGIAVFAGATVMGDGRVALILDVLGVARRSGVLRDSTDTASPEAKAKAETEAETGQPKSSLLVVKLGENYRVALPLDQVHRLEEVKPEQLEEAGGRTVIQYRSGILPLIDLRDFFDLEKKAADGQLPVVVYSNDDGLFGFVVERIEDIIEEILVLEGNKKRRGTVGAAILQKRVTDLLDPEGIICSTAH